MASLSLCRESHCVFTAQVERAAVKRNHEEVEQCNPAVLEAKQHEDNESDNDSASSSDSDAGEKESEQWRWRGAGSKRRREEDLSGKSPWSDESLPRLRKIKPSLRAPESVGMEEEEEEADYDDELKEMQQLLELQLQVTIICLFGFITLCFSTVRL